MNENTDIFICCHSPKLIELPDQTYKIITSEHCNIQSNLNIIREPDNDITKISNKGFAELSRIWWVWNHVDLKNYVGFCHYRRYFDFFSNFMIGYVEDMDKIFKDFDAIVPHPYEWNQYNTWNPEFLYEYDMLGDAIKYKFPEYLEFYEETKVVYEFYPCNMFVFRTEDFDKYCKFVFGVLFEWCHRLGIHERYDDDFLRYANRTNRPVHESRICGHLGERLMYIFLRKNFDMKKIMKLDIIYPEHEYGHFVEDENGVPVSPRSGYYR